MRALYPHNRGSNHLIKARQRIALIEALPKRLNLSAVVVDAGLHVDGTDQKDVIGVTFEHLPDFFIKGDQFPIYGSDYRVSVSVNGVLQKFAHKNNFTGGILIDGKGGDDVIIVARRKGTTGGRDITVVGGPGNDRISAIAALIEGGAGNDRIDTGEVGAVLGGSGNDAIRAAAIPDSSDGPRWQGHTLAGGSGNDSIIGSPNPDRIVGGSGDDYLDGSSGNDTLNGEGGADTFIGGTGLDVVDYSSRTAPVSLSIDGFANDGEALEHDKIGKGIEWLIGGLASDRISGGPGNEIIEGRAGKDSIAGGGGDDLLRGGNGADLLDGADGNDTLAGSADTDRLIGGDGSDTADYSDHTSAVSLSLDAAANDGAPGENENLGSDIENLTAGVGNDTITGSSRDNQLRGGDGDDTISGGSGNDTIDGGFGTDTMDAGPGTDTADYSSHGNQPVRLNFGGVIGVSENEIEKIGADFENLKGGNGDDIIEGDGRDNVLDGGLGSDLVVGNGGNDRLSGSDPAAPFRAEFDKDDDTLDGGDGNDTITGGSGMDRLTYLNLDVPLHITEDGVANDGRPGELDSVEADVEVIFGGPMNDTLIGGAQANFFYGDVGNDVLEGGGGDDTLSGGFDRDTLRGQADDDTLIGGPDPDLLDGGGDDDTADYSQVTGVALTITLDGVANDGAPGENDQVLTENARGGDGNDRIVGNDDRNSLVGGLGDDVLIGNGGDDALYGDALRNADDPADDDRDARDGNDQLDGGAGDDLIRPGGGNDILTGGNGIDTADYSDAARFGAFDPGVGVTITLDGVQNDGWLSDAAPAPESDNVQLDVENAIGTNGRDTLIGSPANNQLDGGHENDSIDGAGGDDLILPGTGDDHAVGGEGNDVFANRSSHSYPFLDADTVDGGNGFDLYQEDFYTFFNSGQSFSDTLTNVELNYDPLTTGSAAQAQGLVPQAVATAVTARVVNGVLTITGTAASDTISVTQRASKIYVETALGSVGTFNRAGLVSVSVDAAGGSDIVRLTRAKGAQPLRLPALITGGPGNDILYGGAGGTAFYAGPTSDGNDVLIAGAGIDYAVYSRRSAPLALSLDGVANDGAAGEADNLDPNIEFVIGGSGNDVISGAPYGDNLLGGRGDDAIFGNLGNDNLIGSSGRDLLSGGDGRDRFFLQDGEIDRYRLGPKGQGDIPRFDVDDQNKPLDVLEKG